MVGVTAAALLETNFIARHHDDIAARATQTLDRLNVRLRTSLGWHFRYAVG
jgi:hypothetical protein